MPNVINYGESNISAIRREYQREMSRVADFDRSSEEMASLLEKVKSLCDSFFEMARIADKSEISELYKLYDMLITQKATLSAMLLSAKSFGTHGSAMVDRKKIECENAKIDTRIVTRGGISEISPISKMPNPELWFETLLRRSREVKQ